MQQVLSTCQHVGCVFTRWVTRRHGACIDPRTDVVSVASHDVWKTVRGILTSYFFITQEVGVYTCLCVSQNTQKQTNTSRNASPSEYLVSPHSCWHHFFSLISSSATAFNDVRSGTWPPPAAPTFSQSHPRSHLPTHLKNWAGEKFPSSSLIVSMTAALCGYPSRDHHPGIHLH